VSICDTLRAFVYKTIANLCLTLSNDFVLNDTNLDEGQLLGKCMEVDMATILVVDDDISVMETVSQILIDAGHHVLSATSADQAIEIIHMRIPDLLILDIIMPEKSGLELCQHLRGDPFNSKIPIIFLSVKRQTLDIARGLDLGGDDYLTKPFEVVELPARVRSVLRRAAGGELHVETNELVVGDLRLSLTRSEMIYKEQVIQISATEYRLIHYLMQYVGQPVSVDQLLEQVWNYPPGTGDPTLVYVHVGNLRSKLDQSGCPSDLLRNIRGRGYLIARQSAA